MCLESMLEGCAWRLFWRVRLKDAFERCICKVCLNDMFGGPVMRASLGHVFGNVL